MKMKSAPSPKTKSKLPAVRSLGELQRKAADDPRYRALAIAAARNLGMPSDFQRWERERDELRAAMRWLDTCALEAGDDEAGVVEEVNFCR